MKIHRLPPHRRVSMEAIQYQGKSMMYFDLVQAVNLVRETNDTDKFAVDLGNIINRHTKMLVRIVVDDDYGACYAEPALFDANNPYVKLLTARNVFDTRLDPLERNARALAFAADLNASVDLKSNQVGGIFTKMLSTIHISKDVILPHEGYQLASEESAALIGHEIGHLWSFFEKAASTVATNIVVETATAALATTQNPTLRMQILTKTATSLGAVSSSETIAAAAESNDSAVVGPLLIRLGEEGRLERLGLKPNSASEAYQARSIEYMADQYVVRLGAAVPLASALHTLAKWHVPDYGKSNAAFLSTQLSRYTMLGLVGAGATLLGGPASVAFYVLVSMLTMVSTAGAMSDDYDMDVSERLGRIKQDLVQLLKIRTLTAQQRKAILNDVEAVDVLRAESKSHGGVIRFIYRNMVPAGRRAAKVREYQKGLEDLVNNDLFVIGHRLGNGR